MTRLSFLLLFQFLFVVFAAAQNTDTLPVQPTDTTPRIQTQVRKPIIQQQETETATVPEIPQPAIVLDTAWKQAAAQYTGKTFLQQLYQTNKFFSAAAAPIVIRSNIKQYHGKEVFFYTFIALLLFFASIRTAFMKYFSDLFQVAFRTTMKQRQIGEQLVQTPLPSLLLNFFFLITGAFYLNFLLQRYGLDGDRHFWLLNLYCFAFLFVIYLIKFVSLKFFGWLFNIVDTTNTYIFIVFMINKIIGIFLLPFVVLFAFSGGGMYQAAFTFSFIVIFALFGYRIILSYSLVRNQIRVNPFQFFLYLCAFEIAPLLLIYKLILLWL